MQEAVSKWKLKRVLLFYFLVSSHIDITIQFNSFLDNSTLLRIVSAETYIWSKS